MRYNGKKFILYDESNTPGIIGHSANIFYELNDKLWIGSGQGLILYVNGKFKTFTKENGLISNNIGAVIADGNGDIWIGSSQGLQQYINNNFIVPDYNIKNPFTGRSINFMAYHKELGLIVSCSDGGVYIHSESNPTLIKDSKDIQVSALILKGKPIIGTRSGEIFEITENILIPFSNLPKVDSSVRGMHFTENILWVITSKGLYKVTKDKTYSVLSNGNDHGLLQSIPKAILQDKIGNIWVGTRSRGLYALSPSPFVNYNQNNGFINNSVNSVAEFNKGTFWFATDKGLYSKDEQEFKENKLTQFLKGIRIKHLNATEEYLYISTISEYGVVIWDGNKIETVAKDQGIPHKVTKKTIKDSKGNLWISTSAGIVCIYPNKDIQIFNKDNGFLSDEIYDIFVDSNDRIWVTTVEDGLLRIENNGSYQRFSEREGLMGEMVFSIREDYQGDFWVGTASGCFLIRADDSIFPVSYTQGLPYLYIYNAQPFKEKIYFTSVKGFSYANLVDVKNVAIGLKEKFESRLLDWNKGLAGSPNALSWLYIDSSDNIWIPTHRGVSVYNESRNNIITENEIEIYIEDVKTDKHLFHDPETIILDRPIDYISISYSVPGLSNKPEYFIYFLEGYSRKWSNPTNDYKAVYTGIKSGKYKFKIKALDNFQSTIAYTEISIEIKKDKRSVWIILMIVLIIASTILGLKTIYGRLSNKENKINWSKIQNDYSLAPRELEVVKLLTLGRRDKEIAIELDCAVSTVSNTLSRIYKKTSTGGRYELMKCISSETEINSNLG